MINDIGKICYNVNKDKGTVTAYFSGGADYYALMHGITMDKVFNMNDTTIVEEMAENAAEFLEKNYHSTPVGIARLHPSDEWDEYVGKLVARKKLLKKYYKFQNVMLNLQKRSFEKAHKNFMNRLQQQIDTCKVRLNRCENDLARS